MMAAAEATVVLAWGHKFPIAKEYVMMLFFLTFSTMESGRRPERGRGCFVFDEVEVGVLRKRQVFLKKC